ncbi:MAG: neutral zinc metallopeptidase [Pirellulaceae bacterium]
MRWKGRRQSTNIEDQRGMRTGPAVAGGGGLMIVVIIVLGLMMGKDPQQLVQQVQQAQQQQARQQVNAEADGDFQESAEEKELVEFVSVVLADTEDVWDKIFQDQLGRRYNHPTLKLFRDSVDSACGSASSATGPFYCPGDDKVYLDLSFFNQLQTTFGAKGDFAMAYVIAHEVAHHVQNELGISDQVQRERRAVGEVKANRLSVRLELQADFLSGVWAHHGNKMKGFLERGDIEEAMRCAQAIGDDTLQRNMQGRVVPDSFTHGTSQQRAYWFGKGYETGNIELANELFTRDYDEI